MFVQIKWISFLIVGCKEFYVPPTQFSESICPKGAKIKLIQTGRTTVMNEIKKNTKTFIIISWLKQQRTNELGDLSEWIIYSVKINIIFGYNTE